LPTAVAEAPEWVESPSQAAVESVAADHPEPNAEENQHSVLEEVADREVEKQEIEALTTSSVEDVAMKENTESLEKPTESFDSIDTEEAPLAEVEPEITIDTVTITLENETAPTAGKAEVAPRVKDIGFERFSIAEVLNQSGDKDLILTHLKLKPIQDLKSGIGLNEKFLFIRELFENDHQAYAQAVDALNSRENIEDAEAFIANELLPRYGWEMEKEALLNFLHLILRRFSQQ
jgi:hypothetical protein